MHRGNLLHCFHLEVKNWDISSRVLFSKNAHPSYLGRSLLEGNKDHLLTRQEHQVGSLNNCISELHNMLLLKDWNYKTLNTDTLNLDENKYVYKKNYL